jgi:hypothetical protein
VLFAQFGPRLLYRHTFELLQSTSSNVSSEAKPSSGRNKSKKYLVPTGENVEIILVDDTLILLRHTKDNVRLMYQPLQVSDITLGESSSYSKTLELIIYKKKIFFRAKTTSEVEKIETNNTLLRYFSQAQSGLGKK